MLILMDIGNSRVKWGRLEGEGLMTGQPFDTAGEIAQSLMKAWAGLPPPSRVVVSNVAGIEVASRLDSWLSASFGIHAEFVSSRAQGYGVTSGYRQPELLGCDRWVALVALRHGWDGPACVVDVGTAATFDLLDGQGMHRGGAIAPGLDLMFRALAANTVGVAGAELAEGDWLGDNTGAAIHSGALNAVAGMAERLHRQARMTMGQDVAAILTGGGAKKVAACLDDHWQLVPDLLLRGLTVIAREGL